MGMIPKIKFCGIKEQIHIDFCAQNSIDFVGFVFCESSKRNITTEHFSKLDLSNVNNVVIVFKEASFEKISHILQCNRVDFIQIHGEIPQEFIGDERIIKAFSGETFTQKDFAQYQFCKYFLFDGIEAGSGQVRNFSFAKNLEKITKKPFFLAGGINIANINEALVFGKMMDISSGIEEIRGVKSLKLMKEFLESVNLV
jgi:phosphoribosylanthranilate isomerase